MGKKKRIVVIIGLSLLFIMALYPIIYAIVFNNKNKHITYKTISQELREELLTKLFDEIEDDYEITMTEKEVEKTIKDDLKMHLTIVTENNKQNNNLGVSYGSINLVIINRYYVKDIYYYITTMAHEFMHIKHFQRNEILTNFNAFAYLYEHSNPQFHYAGVWMAIDTLTGLYANNYNFSFLLVDYFNI